MDESLNFVSLREVLQTFLPSLQSHLSSVLIVSTCSSMYGRARTQVSRCISRLPRATKRPYHCLSFLDISPASSQLLSRQDILTAAAELREAELDTKQILYIQDAILKLNQHPCVGSCGNTRPHTIFLVVSLPRQTLAKKGVSPYNSFELYVPFDVSQWTVLRIELFIFWCRVDRTHDAHPCVRNLCCRMKTRCRNTKTCNHETFALFNNVHGLCESRGWL